MAEYNSDSDSYSTKEHRVAPKVLGQAVDKLPGTADNAESKHAVLGRMYLNWILDSFLVPPITTAAELNADVGLVA